MSLFPHPIPAGAIRIPLPDTTQQTDSSCGASCLQAICKYYGRGPEDEWEYVDALGMDPRVGSHAFQIKRLARRLGFTMREYNRMSLEQVRREVDRRHPVMLMIQAWGQERVGKSWRRRRDEGSVVMQVKRQPPVTLEPGDTFYEGNEDVHLVGRNASQTSPARFVVFLVTEKGAPVVLPAQ